MGYSIYLVRDAEIEASEVARGITSLGLGWELDEVSEGLFWCRGEEVALELGELSASSPSEALQADLARLASYLGARVVDDEGCDDESIEAFVREACVGLRVSEVALPAALLAACERVIEHDATQARVAEFAGLVGQLSDRDQRRVVAAALYWQAHVCGGNPTEPLCAALLLVADAGADFIFRPWPPHMEDFAKRMAARVADLDD